MEMSSCTREPSEWPTPYTGSTAASAVSGRAASARMHRSNLNCASSAMRT